MVYYPGMTVIEMCKAFRPGNDEDFKAIVHSYLHMAGLLGLPRLAQACKVAPSTVHNWASGASVPGYNVQSFVVNTIAATLGVPSLIT